MLSIPPDLLSMSFCYVQISTSVLWLIIIVARVAPIVQPLWGHSTAPAKLNISGMELGVWRFVFCNSILLCESIISWSFIDKILQPFRNNRLFGCLSGFLSLHFFVCLWVHMFVILHFLWNVGIGHFRVLGLQWSGAEITAWERT